ncbi:MAG: hypothetical protein JSS35_00960, partial [Proteobacteria bacterium]|nr:hypothetical protein [Pseudomonadota bacterium]
MFIGTVFEHEGGRQGAPETVSEVARTLSQTRWGRFVCLLRDRTQAGWGLYRDPSGAVPAFAWSLGDGVTVVASQIGNLPQGLGPRWPAPNWRRIADFVARPAACATEVLIDDVTAVHPGQLVTFGPTMRIETIWSPSAFAAAPIDDAEAA